MSWKKRTFGTMNLYMSQAMIEIVDAHMGENETFAGFMRRVLIEWAKGKTK